jgi:hypothetical protein
MVKTAVTKEERAAQAANEVVEMTRTGNDALFSGRPPCYPTGCSSWAIFNAKRYKVDGIRSRHWSRNLTLFLFTGIT